MSAANAGYEIRGHKGGKKGGRSIHATRPFIPGDVIARFNDPAIVIPLSHHALQSCNYCLKRETQIGHGGKLRACTGCKTVAYCGPVCQKAHWTHVHKLECKGFQILHKGKPVDRPYWIPTPIRAAAQVMLRPQALLQFEGLEGHVEEWRKKNVTDMKLQAHGVVRCLGLAITPEKLEDAFRVLCKIQTNAFSSTVEDLENGGIFVDTTLAMVNHSCIPNALVFFDGRTATLRATGRIAAGQEINISYIDETQPKVKRQAALSSYHFDCACYKCQHDIDEYQVAMSTYTPELNHLSVMQDGDRFKHPPGGGKPDLVQRTEVLRLSSVIPDSPNNLESQAKHAYLRKAYKTGSYFVKTGKWALEPFAQVVDDASFYFAKDRETPECALAVACLSAYEAHPFKHPVPFQNERLEGLCAVALALSNTAPSPERLVKLARTMAAKKKFPAESVKFLENLDHVSFCQMVLSLIDACVTLVSSADWEILVLAKKMLEDIESLPGREKENSLITAWRRSPKEMEGFCKYGLLEPIRKLSELGKAVLEVDLGMDQDL
ncbi:Histone-lysine N-methyltransferase ASHR1 [Colletotrichum spinosum]|uniref:Histone-lysine N-methyltransferase ASHR1 n=1 Tax=Colletotrichum spinosum TaxID=1347390 RepID=A0A4R8Q8V9_9PEZI|nr:Histone-lysine N-methyltransferase ASHR1 [Colletotrichum spinosum]